MNTEEAFQAYLDLHPDEHGARMIFADFLDEQQDPRGPGYRALGVNGLCSHPAVVGSPCPWFGNRHYLGTDEEYVLPADWFELIDGKGKTDFFWPAHAKRSNATRREVEDAAALAFSRLPEARQAELLTPAPAPAS